MFFVFFFFFLMCTRREKRGQGVHGRVVSLVGPRIDYVNDEYHGKGSMHARFLRFLASCTST